MIFKIIGALLSGRLGGFDSRALPPVGGSLVALLLATMGCAPPLSSFQPAHVAPAGQFQAGMGLDVAVPVGTITRTYDAAKTLSDTAQNGTPLADGQKLQLFDAGLNLALNPPAVNYHLGLAYTLIDRWEVSLRYAASALRLGARYQVLKHDSAPFDLVVGLGVARFSHEFPFGDVIPVLRLEDFVRWQLDVPILIGTSRDWFRAWVGPRFLATRFEAALILDLEAQPDELANLEGVGYYVGAQGGLAVGFRWLFVAAELTVARLVGDADLAALDRPARSVEIDSVVVYPSFGLMGEF